MYLAGRLGISGRQAKALLDARRVLVDGRRVWMAGHRLRPGNSVVVVDAPVPAAHERQAEVLYEDADYLIVNKPADILANGEGGLEARLRRRRGEPELRAAHRLDRDTTGCLLLARSERALALAIEIFRAHGVTKEYRALTFGRWDARVRKLDAPIDGQPAITRVKLVGAGRDASHLAVDTVTGRTHQVRRHLAEAGHPLLGDRQYGPRELRAERFMRVPRQMLHASRLRFVHPVTGRPVEAACSLPDDFRRCLRDFGLPE
jgi:23S rRNA pseudouridine1911/1915/1917 synthase